MSDFVKNTAPLLALLLYTLAVSFLFGAALGRAHRLRIIARHPHQRGPERDR